MALLLRMAVKQKNRLGYMISIGCVLFLILQSLFYIGVNAGLIRLAEIICHFISWKYDHDDYLLLYGNIVVRVPEYQRREN